MLGGNQSAESIRQDYHIGDKHIAAGLFAKIFLAQTKGGAPAVAKEYHFTGTEQEIDDKIAEAQKETEIMQALGYESDLIFVDRKPGEARYFGIQEFIPGQIMDKVLKSIVTEIENCNRQLKSTTISPQQRQDLEIKKLECYREYMSCMKAALEAVKFLHDHDIVHGDFHLGNVHYDRESKTAAALDFGMSQQLNGKPSVVAQLMTDLAPGTHHAPETHPDDNQNRTYYKSSDLYAFFSNFVSESEILDAYQDDQAKREIDEMVQLCYDLSKVPKGQMQMMFGKNIGDKIKGITQDSDPTDRVSVDDALKRIQQIQQRCNAKIAVAQIRAKQAHVAQATPTQPRNTSQRQSLMLSSGAQSLSNPTPAGPVAAQEPKPAEKAPERPGSKRSHRS